MSKWNDIKKSVSCYAEKTASKTRELKDSASLSIRIASREADRDTEYKVLGRLMYKKLKGVNVKDPEALTGEISETMERLDAIISELKTMKKEKAQKQAEKSAQKAARSIKNDSDNTEDEPSLKA